MQAKRTPGPWHQRGVFAYDEHGSQMFNVRPTDAGNDAYREAEHRVAEIVAAHNCHAELLAALKACAAQIEERKPYRNSVSAKLLRNARAIIAKAEGR